MAFPENLTTRTVVGTFLTPRGLPASGYIIFSPQVALHNEDTDELVLPSPVKKNLDSTGSFSVELLDTENLDLAPSGWGYKVSYHISGVTKNEFVTVIPAGEGSIQFSDLVEIDPLELSLTVIQEILDRLDEVETGKSDIDHTHTHEDVTDLGTAALTDTGTGATNTILGNDPRLTDARTPTSHATSHQSGGSDVLAIAQSQVSDLVTDLSNKADLVDGIIPTSQIPSLAINDTFVVADEAAMLALDAQRGDVAIRSDLNRNFVLQTDGASTLAHWVLLSGGSDVVSVNGQTGIISLGPTDVGADPSGTASSLVDDLSGVTNVSAARNALGLGTAAVADTGTGASNVILGNDARLTDTRTPSAHKTSHQSGGSDELTLAQSQVTSLTTDLAARAQTMSVPVGAYSNAHCYPQYNVTAAIDVDQRFGVWPYHFPHAMTIDSVSIRVTTAADAGVWRLAFVLLDGSYGQPYTRLADLGTIDPTGSTGNRTITGLSVAIPKGWVGFGIVPQSSSSGGYYAASYPSSGINAGSTFTPWNCGWQQYISGAIPSTLSSMTAQDLYRGPAFTIHRSA